MAFFGPSGVRALPLAAGTNEGGHYFSYFWSERRCAGGALQQGYAVTSKFIGIFSLSLSSSSLLSTLLLLLFYK